MRLNSEADGEGGEEQPTMPSTAFKRNSRKIAALQESLGRKPTWQEVLAEIAYDKEVKNDDQGLV